MGKRVYMANDGNVYGSKAEAVENENKFNLRSAMSGAGFDVPEDFGLTREQADAIIAAVKPYASRKSYPNRKPRAGANGARKGKAAEAHA